MPTATGVKKRLAYKKETTWGTLAGATGAKQLRRVTSTFNLAKESYESNEQRIDYQVSDFRHGIRSAAGTISGELSAGTYTDFWGSILARDFTSVTTSSPGAVTVAGTGPSYTITRGTGSYITDGIKVGHVIRFTGLTATADNNKNLLVTNLTATVATVVVVNNTGMTAGSTATGAAFSVPGKASFIPLTGHTDQSYTIEEFFTDIAQVEVYTGCKVSSVGLSIPASGFVTSDIGFTGKDLSQVGTTAYFTTPAALGTAGILASVNGVLLVNGAPVAVVTSADLSVERTLENTMAVGSNALADLVTGRIRVTGNLSTYFTDAIFRDYYANETTVALVLVVAASSAANADFVTVTLPKVKINSAEKNDQETSITQSQSFVALLNDVTATGLEATTIQIQDSLAP
jgi:Phage tail tube protein